MPRCPYVLVVGQCSYDYQALARLVQSCGLVPVEAGTLSEARRLLGAQPFGLVLVNRVIDADDSSGIRFIQDLCAMEAFASLPVMLISDLPDAQAQAVSYGAAAGFGKSELRDPAVREILQAALGTD